MNELTGAVARAQLRKLDRITATLRAKKQRLKQLIGALHGCRYRRLHDAQGECATLCTVIFDRATQAAAVARALGTTTVQESGWHVLANMDHVNRHLRQAGLPAAQAPTPVPTTSCPVRSTSASAWSTPAWARLSASTSMPTTPRSNRPRQDFTPPAGRPTVKGAR